ncbi:alpha/beta hydrolase [Maridesulfovibrio sp.]|uniref:alpha/beta hydrolase n=1 Tax=Maridesulfovibrio sp. TaxID=2795000 RepID=UPI002A18ACA9|nr:alpha/beta hydrolase [Maridesulfovibrio sp.]
MMKFRVLVLLAAMLAVSTAGVQAAEDGKKFDAHATSFSYFFKDADMDFHFGNLVLGSAGNGGVEIGEAFYAASQIKDGDAVSWQKEWYELARRVEARGERSLKEGHKVSARDQLLRAAYYYRISLLAMLPDNPELQKRGLKSRSLMIKAGQLFDPPLEYFEIPFENTVLPGFFRKADSSGKPTKTLLMIGGGETYIEDLFFYIARQAHDRGYNFMTVDLPGQGMMPHAGYVFRTDTNVPMKAVVDYALKRKDVDPAKLAAYGISGGGLFVPQAAMHDKRIKAIAMSSAVVDAHKLFADMPAAVASKKDMEGWTSFHGNVVESICWRYGVDKPSGLIEANNGNTFDAGKIAAPALLIVGEGEYRSKEVQRQQKKALDNFTDPRSALVVTPSNEGATNHCLMENRSIVGQVLFDWLDVVFK